MARNLKTGVTVTGDSKGAVKALNLTAKGLAEVDKKAKASSARFEKFSKSLVSGLNTAASQAAKYGSIAAGAVTAAGVAMVKSGLNSVDALAKTSDKLGVTTEALSRLRFAAEQTGVSTQTMDMALQRMTRRVAEAAMGTGEAVGALKELGISATDIAKQSPDQMFREITKAMGGVETQSDKVRLAMKLFDSEGVSLVNTMKGGASALDELAAQADAAGLSISRLDAAKVEAANDAWNRVRSVFTGISQQLAIKFAPLLAKLAEEILDVGKSSGGVANIVGKAFSHMVKGAGFFLDGIRGIQVGWKLLKLEANKSAAFIVKDFDRMAKYLVDIWNKLPWVEKVEFTAFDNFLLSMESGVKETRDEIDELMSRKIPSVALENFVADAERAFAKLVADANDTTKEFAYMSETTTDLLQERLLKARESFAKSHSELNKLAKKDSEESADGIAVAYERGIERMDDGFADFFKTILRDGKVTFDGLKNIFLDTLGEMIYAAARNPIMTTFAIGGGSSTAAASGGAAGGGGVLSSLSSLVGGSVSGLYQTIGTGLSNLGATGLGDMAYNAGLRYSGIGGAAMGIGGGIAGGLLGNAVFGQTSGLGSTLGGIAGGMLIPIPGLGTAIGSFLGSGLESLFNSKPSDKRQYASGGFSATDQILSGFDGRKFSQENQDAAAALLGQIQQMGQQIGGTTAAGSVSVGGRTGFRLATSEGEDAFRTFSSAEALLDAAFEEVLAGATSLAPAVKTLAQAFTGGREQAVAYTQSLQGLWQQTQINPVDQAMEDIAAQQTTLFGAYRNQIGSLRDLVSEYDGSMASTQQLSQALSISQQSAYQLTATIRGLSQEMGAMFESSAKTIRESVMSEEERFRSWINQRDALRASLDTLVDPQKIAEAGREIERLNTMAFNALPNANAEVAESYARVAEAAGREVERQLRVAEREVRDTSSAINQEIRKAMSDVAAEQQRAAEDQKQAAQLQLQAAGVFQNVISQLQARGIPISIGPGGEITP